MITSSGKCGDSAGEWLRPDKGWPTNAPVGALNAKSRIQGIENANAGYYLAVPEEYSPTKAWPLFIVLHGSGTDPSGMISVFRTGLMKKGAIAAFPIAIRNQLLEWNYPHSGAYLLLIIKDVAATYRIDPRRIYLVGHSMGGGGTWAMGAIMPQAWAALGPMSGWALPDPAPPLQNLKGMPIYCIHGKLDKSVPAALSEQAFAELRRLGNSVRQYDSLPDPKTLSSATEINIFREIQGADHAFFLPWKERGAQEVGLMVAWMLNQRRATPANLAAAEKALADWAAPYGWKPDGKLGQYADGTLSGGAAGTGETGDLQNLARQLQDQILKTDEDLANLRDGDGDASWRTIRVPSNFEMQCVGWNGSVGAAGTSGVYLSEELDTPRFREG